MVSPDPGSAKRARTYADRLGGELAIIDKKRVDGNNVQTGSIIGDVAGKTVLMMDDIVSTAGTICGASELCKRQGATNILVGATHAVLCGPAIERLKKAPIDEVIVTDTIPVPQETIDALGKLKVLSLAELIGETIHRIHNNESVSSLFQIENGRR